MPTLPNPGMSFTPFDPLPAADLNDMVENIEAIADLSVFATGDIPRNLIADLGDGDEDYVKSGLVWTPDAAGSTLLASMTAGVVYINGLKVSVSAVNNRAFTASRDTYIDVGTDGVVDYNPQLNNAASPALAANHIRIGIIVTGASSIASAASINQGSIEARLPVVSNVYLTVTDSIGQFICNRSPRPEILTMRVNEAGQSTTSASSVQVTGMVADFIMKRAGDVVFEYYSLGSSSATTNYNETSLHDNSVATSQFAFTSSNIAQQSGHRLVFPRGMTAGTKKVVLGLRAQGGGTSSIIASNLYRCVLIVRRANTGSA